ncbi:MAG TPA: PHB depolymerase family esterase [Candidatus Didemnitutus sp.]|nr:PHB depolymerase family esterase [Candidatus Didemnitutus sp.]
MKIFSVLTLLFALGITSMRAADGGANGQIPPPLTLSVHHQVKSEHGYEALVSLPVGYESSGLRHWPLILFLHGSGESGHDLSHVPVNGPPKLLNPGAKLTDAEANAARILARDFIVVSPQCPDEGIAWLDDDLLATLDEVTAKWRVDADRVYLTGLSMGGYGAWSLGLHHADRFAAVVPISGGANYLDALNAQDGTSPQAKALRHVGIWIVHGAIDPVVPVSEATRLYELLKNSGFDDLRITVVPDHGHDVWNALYADPAFYEWLLQHRRAAGFGDPSLHQKSR